MKKKLFILLFLIITVPVFAVDEPLEDVYVPEEAPVIIHVQNKHAKKITFKNPFKGMFEGKKTQDDSIPENSSAREAYVIEPSHLPDEVKPERKSFFSKKENDKKVKKDKETKAKLAKKEGKSEKKTSEINSNSKNVSKIKELNNMLNAAEKDFAETPASDINIDNNELTNAAYTASINTSRILEVNQCVKTALENHPLIRYAMGNAEVYKSRIAQAWANYFPTFSAGLSYSKNDMQSANFTMPVQRYDMYYVPTLQGNMLLFDFGKTKAQADIAKRSYESAKYTLQNSINNVVFNVKQSYYNLLFAQQQVQVYEDTVKDYTLHLEQANAYYRIGTKPKIDVLTAEYNLGNAKLNLIQAKNTLKIAYVQLSNAMGMPEYSDYEVTDNLTTKEYDINIDDAVKTAYETSPELLAAQKKADAAKLLVRSSVRAFTPNINAFGGYTRGGKKADTDEGYQIGAQLSYSTVNLMLLKKQVDESKAAYKRDLADYENIKQNVYFNVKEAYINLVNAQESIVVAKLSMNRAKEQYDMASGRYKVGLGDAIELKDAETTYRNSQLSYYNALLSYHVSAANLERIIGVPIETSDNELL